jgi:hypothetical protein
VARNAGLGLRGTTLFKDSWCVREGFVISFEELERVLWEDEYTDAEGNRYVVTMAV